MNPIFSNHFVRNGLVVDFHRLEVLEQHQALESNMQLSILLYALQCIEHPDFTLSVHLEFEEGQLHNTIFCCCESCKQEVELALLACTFPTACYSVHNGRKRHVG